METTNQTALTKLTDEEIKELWGEDLYEVFAHHIDEFGRLTSKWHEIIEDEIPKWDKDFNDNPLHKETYGRMYSLEYDLLENETLIIPNKQPYKEPELKDYEIGQQVNSQKFGIGEVLSIDGKAVVVAFADKERRMHRAYAILDYKEN